MPRPRVYLETSVISYLTARLSRDLVTAARQELTQEWWEKERHQFEVFVSDVVLTEAGRGDVLMAEKRLAALEGVQEVAIRPEARELARSLTEPGPIPQQATIDAFHVAGAVSGGADYLLTWNFKHLANAALRKRIESICRQHGFEPPVICTPEELMEP